MRTIKLIPGIPKNTDTTKFPDSTIKNEVDGDEGTPVVEEIYGDILTNIYKLLRLSGVTANGLQDSEISQYQLIEALQKFSNTMNDIEQQLNLTGTIFSIGLDLSILPNKYVCFARSVEDYDSSLTYTFKGSNATILPFTSVTGFKSGSTVLLVIDTAGVRAFKVSEEDAAVVANEIFTPFGTPLAFNDSEKVFYQSAGFLFSDKPESYDLQAAIRLLESDGTILVYEMLLIAGYLYCLAFTPGTLTYNIYRFAVTDFTTPELVSFVTGGFPTGVIANDYQPNIYTDGANLYITNSSGSSANNYAIAIYSINLTTGALTSSGSINLDVAFDKTTNAVVKANMLYTFVAGVLSKYNLGTGVKTALGFYPTFVGLLFQYKSEAYYSNGEVAKKWSLS